MDIMSENVWREGVIKEVWRLDECIGCGWKGLGEKKIFLARR